MEKDKPSGIPSRYKVRLNHVQKMVGNLTTVHGEEGGARSKENRISKIVNDRDSNARRSGIFS